MKANNVDKAQDELKNLMKDLFVNDLIESGKILRTDISNDYGEAIKKFVESFGEIFDNKVITFIDDIKNEYTDKIINDVNGIKADLEKVTDANLYLKKYITVSMVINIFMILFILIKLVL